MKRAIIYARVSTEDQAQHGYSLVDQIDKCILRAKEEGAEKIIHCVDEGFSGDLLARPGLTKARNLIKTATINLFICFDPDRLARKLAHQLIITDEIEKHGCKLVFVNFNWQNTSEGRLFYSLRGAIAEFEKEKIRERTMRGLRQKALQGGLTHNPDAYGYDYNQATNSLIINEREAEVYHLISSWFLDESLGYSAIARRLTSMGIPTKRGAKRWAATTVLRMLSNPLYKGELWLQRYDTVGKKNNKYLSPDEKVKVTEHPKDHRVLIKVPAIITSSTFHKQLQQAKRISRLSKSRANYLLSGLVFCGLCQSAMTGTRNSHNAYYRCTKGQHCPQPYLPSKVAENAIWNEVIAMLSNKQILDGLNVSDAECYEVQVLRRQLYEGEKEYERLINLIQRGYVSLDDTEERLTSVKDRINRLNISLQSQSTKKEQEQDPKTFRLSAKLKSLSFKGKQRVVRSLAERIVVFPDYLILYASIPPLVAANNCPPSGT
ncbi:MAG: recombinase family protein [Bacillota bacterium]|nr:recombinase family protein [Bacillota bacterium]